MFSIPGILGMGLNFTLDGFRIVYCLIALFMWVITGLFSVEYLKHESNRFRYHFFTVLTFIATEGVLLSADFFTLFVFFEIMSLASYVWVAFDERKESLRAADTYMAIAVIGGLAMLMGITLLYSISGTLKFDELADIYSKISGVSGIYAKDNLTKLNAAGFLMLFGFFAKAGAFPLHIWLPKAHPVAPAPASALLSGMLTKAGIFGVLILSCRLFTGSILWGIIVLIIGVITMFHGALLALLSVDLKRTLACSSVSQIGFILTGIGTSVLLMSVSDYAIYGAFMHMVNHSLIKLCLFTAAGVVFMNVHKLNLNDIRGFGRNKPLLMCIFLIGSLGIGGVPFFNGYISKTLIHESILEYMEIAERINPNGFISASFMRGVNLIFIISGGLTVAYMTKLFICIFVEKNEDEKIQKEFDSLKGRYMSKLSAFALTSATALLPIAGLFSGKTLVKLADMSAGFLGSTGNLAVRFFTFENVEGAVISICIGILVYVIVVRGFLMSKVPVNDLGIEEISDALSGELKLIKENAKTKRYIYRWNRYFDLEDYILRPLILGFLPYICSVICRFLDSIVDCMVVFLRKTVYRDLKLPQELEEGNTVTHLFGVFLNKLQDIRNIFIGGRRKKSPTFNDYEHKAVMNYERIKESVEIILRSMSFGLILFCIGLLLTVMYIFISR